ncbi:unnamed protein product, partial [Tenebrio molitor]
KKLTLAAKRRRKKAKMGHPSRVSLLGNAALFDYTNVLSVCDVISLFQQKARRVYMGFKNADLHVG